MVKEQTSARRKASDLGFPYSHKTIPGTCLVLVATSNIYTAGLRGILWVEVDPLITTTSLNKQEGSWTHADAYRRNTKCDMGQALLHC